MEKIYDVIVIGGGPSGLICAITAVMGTPLNQRSQFSGLIIEKSEIGAFAKYGKLRITPGWHFMGSQLVNVLLRDAKKAGLNCITGEEVTDAKLDCEMKLVITEKNVYQAKKVAVCTGFFPYGYLSRYTNHIRTMFSPVETEVQFMPQQKGYDVAVMGGERGTCKIAGKLKNLRPDLDITVIITDSMSQIPGTDESNAAYDIPEGKILTGSVKVKKETREYISLNIESSSQNGKPGKSSQWKGNIVLINYNSYIHHSSATSFLKNTSLKTVCGYIDADREGNTGIPGVVAAGNITTPVSGVMTALSTGFTAGLNLHQQLYGDKYQTPPLHFPWLSLDDPKIHPLLSGKK